jgi:hypothetical protein
MLFADDWKPSWCVEEVNVANGSPRAQIVACSFERQFNVERRRMIDF